MIQEINTLFPAGLSAPDFTLLDQEGRPTTLSALRGKPVILAFYPADFTAVCGSQLTLYNEVLPLFDKHEAQLLGISVDSVESHAAFSAENGFRFPLLADSDPHGEVAQAFGVYDSSTDTSGRALFVLDSEGRVQWSHLSPRGINPGANGILDALEGLP
jgi:peroxiredoxin